MEVGVDVNICLVVFKLFGLLHARAHGILINALIKERWFVCVYSFTAVRFLGSLSKLLLPGCTFSVSLKISRVLLKFLLISSELSLINFTQISVGEIEGSYLAADFFLGMSNFSDNRLTEIEP